MSENSPKPPSPEDSAFRRKQLERKANRPKSEATESSAPAVEPAKTTDTEQGSASKPAKVDKTADVKADKKAPKAVRKKEKSKPTSKSTATEKTRGLIDFQDVSIQYSEHPVLEHVDFAIQPGEFVYIVGRTGGGKSSLLKLMYADIYPAAGKAFIDKYYLNFINDKERPFLRRRLGIVFQDFQLLPDRTVAENLEFVMKATGWTDKSKMKARMTEVLMQVGLSSKLNSMPHQLSGGEQQRTVLARALVNNPAVIIADEPTGNLDPEVTTHIMEILMKIHRSGTAIVMATHEHELIDRYPARVLECRDGRVIDKGKPEKKSS